MKTIWTDAIVTQIFKAEMCSNLEYDRLDYPQICWFLR